MKVTIKNVNGRTYVDVVDLIRAIDKAVDKTINKKDLLAELWMLDEQGQNWIRPDQKCRQE